MNSISNLLSYQVLKQYSKSIQDDKHVSNIKKGEEFEDTKEVIRICISKKNRQHNGQKKKDKRTNNDLQNIAHKTKDRVTRTPLKIEGDLICSRKVSSSCSTIGTRCVTIVTNPPIDVDGTLVNI